MHREKTERTVSAEERSPADSALMNSEPLKTEEKTPQKAQWNQIRSSLSESMKTWVELEETLRGYKSADEIKLEEMKDLIQKIHQQMKDLV
jgi:hypothetical protein